MFESERNDSNQEQRILGVLWNTDTDKILLDFKHITQQARQLEPTKRNMVRLVAKIYYPLGFISPVQTWGHIHGSVFQIQIQIQIPDKS